MFHMPNFTYLSRLKLLPPLFPLISKPSSASVKFSIEKIQTWDIGQSFVFSTCAKETAAPPSTNLTINFGVLKCARD